MPWPWRWRRLGVGRAARLLLKINQPGGFDCPGCAWPEPSDRGHLEFCENGAKALAEEATVRRCGPELFAEPLLASAALDRLAHDAHQIVITGDSYRTRATRRRTAERRTPNEA